MKINKNVSAKTVSEVKLCEGCGVVSSQQSHYTEKTKMEATSHLFLHEIFQRHKTWSSRVDGLL